MRKTAVFVVVLLSSSLILGGQIAQDSLDGEWLLSDIKCFVQKTNVVEKDLVVKHAKNNDYKAIVRENKGVIYFGDEKPRSAPLRVNKKVKPTQLDLLDWVIDGKGDRHPLRCIFKIEGDLLVVAFHLRIDKFTYMSHFPVDGTRPNSFEPVNDDPLLVLTFKRKAR